MYSATRRCSRDAARRQEVILLVADPKSRIESSHLPLLGHTDDVLDGLDLTRPALSQLHQSCQRSQRLPGSLDYILHLRHNRIICLASPSFRVGVFDKASAPSVVQQVYSTFYKRRHKRIIYYASPSCQVSNRVATTHVNQEYLEKWKGGVWYGH